MSEHGSQKVSMGASLGSYEPQHTKDSSKPAPIDDPVLGQLNWDDRLDCWEGQVRFYDKWAVKLNVAPEIVQGAARMSMTWLLEHEPSARHYAAAELLELYNDTWRVEGDVISAETFVGLLTLEHVSLEAEGGACLSYDDGDLFAGHSIDVCINSDRSFWAADISG